MTIETDEQLKLRIAAMTSPKSDTEPKYDLFVASNPQKNDDRNIVPVYKGDSIRSTRYGDSNYPKFQELPKCIYFYYCRINDDGRLAVDHYKPYFKPDKTGIKADELKNIIKALAYNGRPSTTNKNPPLDQNTNFQNLVWNHKSYIVIFMDEEYWKLASQNDGLDAVYFRETQSGPTQYRQNKTFYDAIDLELKLKKSGGQGSTDVRTAVCFINHMKDDQGDDLAEDPYSYKFDIFFRAEFSNPIAGERLTIIFDPTGDNQGPPLPPP